MPVEKLLNLPCREKIGAKLFHIFIAMFSLLKKVFIFSPFDENFKHSQEKVKRKAVQNMVIMIVLLYCVANSGILHK